MNFDEADPRHMAAARALCEGLDYGPYEALGVERGFVRDLALKVVSAVAPLSWLTVKHRRLEVCPGCGQGGLGVVGIVDLAYEFVVCECDTLDYPHLVEQLWHRAHIGRPRDQVALTTRRDTLAEVAKMLTAAASTDRPRGNTSMTYAGGLRRAGRLTEQLLHDSPELEGDDRS